MITEWLNSFFDSEEVKEKKRVEQWLADSESLQEIERKQRMINRGQAPWQVQTNHNLKGWI